jgi:polyisoprenoid-binding protein YceI
MRSALFSRLSAPVLALGLACGVSLGSATAVSAADSYICDPGHTDVRFVWVHAGFSRQSGGIRSPECTLVLDDDEPTKSTLKVTLKLANLATGVPDLDTDLRGPGFFDAAKFPEIKFESTKIQKTGAKTADVTGNLTIKDITKTVTIEVRLVRKGEHPMGEFFPYYKGKWAGFNAVAYIKRSDFKVDKFAPIMSDDVTINIAAEMKGP